MRKPRQGGSNVAPLDGDGATVVLPAGQTGFTLLAGHTYFYELGSDGASFIHAHAKGDAAIIITSAVLEDADFDDVASISVVAGDWIPQDPAAGFCAKVGAGWAFANSTLSVAGGAGGGASWNLAATAAKRRRMKVVVGGTGGVFRVGTHGKD